MVFTAHIPLGTSGRVAVIDRKDLPLLDGRKWLLSKNNGRFYAYARDKGKERRVWMHRVIAGVTARWVLVDHKDGDGLHNRRMNLRVADQAQNCQNKIGLSSNNTSGASGIYWWKVTGTWHVIICYRRRRYNLGYFKDKQEAIEIRRAAEVLLFGEFAPANEVATGKYVGTFGHIDELVDHVRTLDGRVSASGIIGVVKIGSKWKVELKDNSVKYYLGSHRDKREAIEIRRAAEMLVLKERAPRLTSATGKYVGKFICIEDLCIFAREASPRPSKSGIAGVTYRDGKWRAQSSYNRIKYHHGTFTTAKQAAKAVHAFRAAHGLA